MILKRINNKILQKTQHDKGTVFGKLSFIFLEKYGLRLMDNSLLILMWENVISENEELSM